MRPPGASPSPASVTWDRDPVAAAEEEIRRYLIAHHVSAPVDEKHAKGHPVLCLLGVYAGLALIVALTLMVVGRMECDPLFTDRGLSDACRAWGKEVVSANSAIPLANGDDF
jgi:hypothetical protein